MTEVLDYAVQIASALAAAHAADIVHRDISVEVRSPEQASARPLDHGTDISGWVLVLYEMIAGKRPLLMSGVVYLDRDRQYHVYDVASGKSRQITQEGCFWKILRSRPMGSSSFTRAAKSPAISGH